MKLHLTIILILLISIQLPTSIVCAENSQEAQSQRQLHQPPPPPDGGIGIFNKQIHDKLVGEVISELLNKEIEDIKQDCKGKIVPQLLEKYGIEPKAFHSLMSKKMIIIVEEAVDLKRITETKGNEIIERIKNHPGPPEKSRQNNESNRAQQKKKAS